MSKDKIRTTVYKGYQPKGEKIDPKKLKPQELKSGAIKPQASISEEKK